MFKDSQVLLERKIKTDEMVDFQGPEKLFVKNVFIPYVGDVQTAEQKFILRVEFDFCWRATQDDIKVNFCRFEVHATFLLSSKTENFPFDTQELRIILGLSFQTVDEWCFAPLNEHEDVVHMMQEHNVINSWIIMVATSNTLTNSPRPSFADFVMLSGTAFTTALIIETASFRENEDGDLQDARYWWIFGVLYVILHSSFCIWALKLIRSTSSSIEQ
eukprot:jgi/Bigna1/132304/aug1.17_g7012